MGHIRGDTGGARDVEERQFRDEGVLRGGWGKGGRVFSTSVTVETDDATREAP